jgi:hypothetical protein
LRKRLLDAFQRFVDQASGAVKLRLGKKLFKTSKFLFESFFGAIVSDIISKKLPCF